MNTLRISGGHTPYPCLSRQRRSIAIGLMCLVLAACGGGGGTTASSTPGAGTPANGSNDPAPGTGGGSSSNAPVLDCVREGYPCSFDEVPLPIIERSLSLTDEVAQQLESGVDIHQVAAFLAAQSDVADVTVDGPVLGFRLDGGRPMIVDVTGEQEFLPAASALGSAETATSVANQTTGIQKLSTVRSAVSSKITGGDETERHALVLSPFRYEENFGTAGELVASALNEIRGYKGNVTYLATTDERDPQVTIDVLTQLEGYDVIHIDTHGGVLCKKKAAPVAGSAKIANKQNCEQGITDFLVQRFHGTAQDLHSIAHPGVIYYRGRLHESIAVTADFFRHYYPEGLTDTLFILGSCNTFRTDMADAIAGNSGIYASWDHYTEFSLVKNTSLHLLDSLGAGLTVGEAFARMPTFAAENPAAEGSMLLRTPRKAGGDLRIRDLLTVRDNLTGKLVTDASGIEVMEEPEDGQNDRLDLEFIVDGITPEQLENFYVNLVIDDEVIGHLNLKQSGVAVGDFSYRVSGPVPLPFDVREGQALNMDFWIPLPDLGEDHFVAAPKVNEREEHPVGVEWVLGSKLTHSHIDSTTIIEASVVFEVEPDNDPEGSYHYFRVKHGTVRVQRDYEDALQCRFQIDHTIEIPAGAPNNYLRFDVSGASVLVKGFGNVPKEYIPVTGSCGDTVSVGVGGVYLLTEDTIVTGDSAQGVYHDGAALPTTIEWSLDRTL